MFRSHSASLFLLHMLQVFETNSLQELRLGVTLMSGQKKRKCVMMSFNVLLSSKCHSSVLKL